MKKRNVLHHKQKHTLLLLIALFFGFNLSSGQSTFEYIHPVPGSEYVMPENNIAFRIGDPIKKSSLGDIEITVAGTESGMVEGTTHLSTDGRTLFFEPHSPYLKGEQITVRLEGSLETLSSKRAGNIEFSFTVANQVIDMDERPGLMEKIYGYREMPHPPAGEKIPYNRQLNDDPTLPDDFPVIDITQSNNPPVKGYYFIAPSWGGWVFPGAPAYLIIFDNYGTPVYYKKSPFQNNNLDLQPNGMLTYHDRTPQNHFAVMNSNLEIVDTYVVQNGYTNTDHHDFLMLPNGHVFLFAYDAQLVDMSGIVPGGKPGATVVGLVIQELDEEKNVVFQWRSWDHYEITDANDVEDLTADYIDYVHANSIEIDSDTSFIISSRNMDEITRIDKRTGEIIWRLNGKNNMFTFVNDPLTFSYQHDARILSDGTLSIFDNGQYHPEPKFSSAVEYIIDEQQMTATLVKRWRSDPDIYGSIMGNSQEVETGGRVVGWGSGVPGITEFHPDGTTALEVYIDNFNYKAYRYEWETTAFDLSEDTLDFGEVYYQGTGKKGIYITNNLDSQLEINHVHTRTQYFEVNAQEMPLTIGPGGTRFLAFFFYPDAEAEFTDVLTICNNIESDELIQRIAKQLPVKAVASEEAGIDEPVSDKISVDPNPSRGGIFYINGINPAEIESISILSSDGSILNEITNSISRSIDLTGYPSGMYILKITHQNKVFSQRVIKL